MEVNNFGDFLFFFFLREEVGDEYGKIFFVELRVN